MADEALHLAPASMHYRMVAPDVDPITEAVSPERDLAASMILEAILAAEALKLRDLAGPFVGCSRLGLAVGAVSWMFDDRTIGGKRRCGSAPCGPEKYARPEDRGPCREHHAGRICPRLTYLECAEILGQDPAACRSLVRADLRRKGIVIE